MAYQLDLTKHPLEVGQRRIGRYDQCYDDLLDHIERGEHVVMTREGEPLAEVLPLRRLERQDGLPPSPAAQRRGWAVDILLEMNPAVERKVSVQEVDAWRKEGRR